MRVNPELLRQGYLKKQTQFKPNFVMVSDDFVIASIVTEESRAFPVAGSFV